MRVEIPNTNHDLVIHRATAKMPSSCKFGGDYIRLGLMRVERGAMPKMIAQRARGVIDLIETRERLFDGKTDRCMSARALCDLQSMAAKIVVAYAIAAIG